ncbi:MAG: hypothetical protein ACRDPD_17995, partial [Streptosporangiaceae bacterium]
RDFGGLARGTTLSFAVAGDQHSRAFLPVEPAGAEVIATDARGRPALLLRRKCCVVRPGLALITGASSGTGKAYAEQLVSEALT